MVKSSLSLSSNNSSLKPSFQPIKTIKKNNNSNNSPKIQLTIPSQHLCATESQSDTELSLLKKENEMLLKNNSTLLSFINENQPGIMYLQKKYEQLENQYNYQDKTNEYKDLI